MTALGPIAVRRVHFTCFACGLGRHPAYAILGIDGHLTTQAIRLVCLAGGQRPFGNAAMLLKELCGWRISDELVRQICHAEADRIAAWRADPQTPAGPPIPPTEFQVDATKVNTFTGWREMKIGVFARRSLHDRQNSLVHPTASQGFRCAPPLATVCDPVGPAKNGWLLRISDCNPR